MKPKKLEEAEEEMAKKQWIEENIENTVRCPICRGVLKLSVPTIEDVEKEEGE